MAIVVNSLGRLDLAGEAAADELDTGIEAIDSGRTVCSAGR